MNEIFLEKRDGGEDGGAVLTPDVPARRRPGAASAEGSQPQKPANASASSARCSNW